MTSERTRSKPRFSRSFLVSLVAFLPLIGLAGCGSSESSNKNRDGDVAAANQVFYFNNSSEPPSLDPQRNTSVNGSRIIAALMEGLIAYHETDDNIPEPGMAERWEHQDYTVWTFHLRDAKWSNGDPVIAQHFVTSYERMLNPKFAARYVSMLYFMKGAEAYSKGELTDFSKVGVKALDDKTLEITLNGPTPYFPNVLKHGSWYPIHPPTVLKYGDGDIYKQDSKWTQPEGYVGTGPFILKEWVTNQIIRIEKNPNYWDADTVGLNEIQFLTILNKTTADLSFQGGTIHYSDTLPSDLISIYAQAKEPTLRQEPYLGTYFYRMNTTVEPLDDKRVRQALSMAINRKAIVKLITKGGQQPATGYTPPGIQGYEPPKMITYNPKRARELLAEAGFPNGDGFPKMTLMYNTSEDHKAIAESVQEMWKKVLNIDIRMQNQEWKVYLDTLHQMNYQMARSAWIGDYMYPDTFLQMWQTGDGNNETGWGDERYDSLIKGSLVEIDRDKRQQMLYEAETILLEELPIIPIYFYSRSYRIDNRLKGWHPKLLDNRNYKYLYFEN